MIGLVEGAVTAVVLVFIYEVRPELLWNYERRGKKKGRLSDKQTIAVFAAAAVVIGGLISLVASAAPDGLEWSVERVAGKTELVAEGGIYTWAEKLQSLTSLLPDYTWKNSDAASGTIFSGIFGGIVVIAVCAVICFILKRFRRKRSKEPENE